MIHQAIAVFLLFADVLFALARLYDRTATPSPSERGRG